MNRLIAFSFLCSLLVVTGCTHLNSVSLTSIPAERTNEIKVERSKTIFLGFNFDNDYVDEMNKELQEKCPNGKVQGLLTKDEFTDYFLVVTKRVTARGICITDDVATVKKDQKNQETI